ncbi:MULTISPECIES: hypothetical protein [Streptomyces]|uniref:Uncharacterized protein n=1 Tax=Streptomyces pratisoli TaxID=3139917 RepID=A0ACC6QKX3_9ACTN|nr:MULTISPECIES: hypothetical protein [unclassified Streptomyces]MCX4512561.1 hypothetical protein [Streptomyces sp. NBC_01619]
MIDQYQYPEYTTPSQAEGEDTESTEEQHPDTPRTTPSQAEGERTADDDR